MTAVTRPAVSPLARALAVALVAALAAGCAIPPEGAARQVEPPRGARTLTSATPPAAGAGSAEEKLYLVKDDKLVPVIRRVPVAPTVDTLVRDLLAGPTNTERDTGITSALLGTDVIAGVHLDGSEAIIELTAALDETGRTDQVLAFAQIVYTVTDRAEITGVSFTRDGRRVGVPRADGSLSPGPLTAADYTSLLSGQ